MNTAFFFNTQMPATTPEIVPAGQSTGAAIRTRGIILPMVWATAASPAELNPGERKPATSLAATKLANNLLTMVVAPPKPVAVQPEQTAEAPVALELAFYRKYTEALIRRYVKISMEAGRAPSMLGREMFRGRVTAYRVHSFEDSVIFIHDIERCITKLDRPQQQILYRIAQQEYTLIETATLLAVPLRTVLRRYGRALDTLTHHLLEHRLLEPLKTCQGV